MAILVISSNRLEVLFEALKEALLDAFMVKVVVPSQGVKSWIQTRLARELGVAAGITFHFLEETVTGLPSKVELALRIELLLKEKSFEEVERYCLGKSRRLVGLSYKLAECFYDALIYGKPTFEGWLEDVWCLLDLKPPEMRGDDFHFFGFSHIPPAYLQSGTLYLLSPCEMYWEDVRSDVERVRLARFFKEKGAAEASLAELDSMLRDANPLLANLGRLGRRYFLEGEDRFAAPEGDSQLARVQRDILCLDWTNYPSDGSIQVHSAPSKLREVEALAELIDDDTIVMAPNIDAYIPYIEAVFGDNVPFQIQDMRGEADDALLRLLSLLDGRFGASEVLDLWEGPDVRRWIQLAGIRWGRNVEHQKALVSPYGSLQDASGRGSWEQGIGRLLDALTETGEIPFSDADLLEKFVVWVESLLKKCKRPMTFEEAYSEFGFEPFRRLAEQFPEEIFSFASIRRAAVELTQQKISTLRGYELGGVRFSAMKALPAKTICLLGIDEEGYPRSTQRSPFPTLKPSLGEIDRYLFLETFLSARERFIVFGSPALLQGLEVKSVEHREFSLPPQKKVEASTVVHPPRKGHIVIDVKDLQVSARDPAKLFLRERGIYFDDRLLLHDHEDFTLSPLDEYRAVMGDPVQLPGGPLGEFSQAKLQDRLQEVEKNLGGRTLETRSIHRVIDLGDTTVELIGDIPNTTGSAIWVPGRRDLPTAIKAYPLLLAAEANELLFGRHKKSLHVTTALEDYLRYHLLSLENLIPLAPDWVKAIKAGDPITQFPRFVSPYLEWAAKDPNEQLKPFRRAIVSAFTPLLDAWEPK